MAAAACFSSSAPRIDLELAAPERHRARRHDHDVLAVALEIGHVGTDAFEPRAIERAGLLVDE